jgi:ATP phosphoribosyltransferase regulatory subunit
MDRAIKARAEALKAHFEAAGAVAVETPILQPAEVLLDLYGEDIRARAYVTQDPLRGEQMLRPDFTVPVVQMHMAFGAEPARYTYAGEVFRRQEADTGRPSEYMQVGYEVFDRADPAQSDAEVFALVSAPLSHLALQAKIGDIGLLIAAVNGLKTTEARKAALRRHIWRPKRFRALLDRYAGQTPVPVARIKLLAAADPFAETPTEVGLRGRGEVENRIAALRADAAAPPLEGQAVANIYQLLAVKGSLPAALEELAELARKMPEIVSAVRRIEARSAALQARSINLDRIVFDAAYGRSSMEYYDGFVFGLYVDGASDSPAVASGGRYDALTLVLGQGAEIPAVGGVIRPEMVLSLEAHA